MNSTGTTNLVLCANFPTKLIFGTKFLCSVFFIHLPKIISNPGITKNTDKIAKMIALIKQIAMSWPNLNCINIIATIPPMVVKQLLPISGIAFDNASITASFRGNFSYSSLKRFTKITV